MATYKPKRKLQDGQLEEIKIPSSSVEGLNLFTYKARIKPYLYTMVYDTLDYDYAKQYIDEKYNHYSAGCSTISKGNFVGRNFDWYYDNEASFVVRTSRSQGRYASVGVASGIKELSDEFANSNENSNLYKVLPFLMEDGINEHSVYCNINVVPAGDKGLTSGTTPQIEQLDKISGVMLVRYILDKFSSAKEAVEYIRDYVSVYGLKPENGEAQEFHFLVRDLTNTYILEFVNNALVILSSTDSRFTAIPNNKDIMMNFYLSGWNGQVKSVVMGNSVADVQATGLTDHAMGLERYNIASNKYNNLTTKEAFVDLMTNDLKYTQTYDENTSPFWHSEYNAQYQTFGDVTIYSAASAYSEVEAYSKGKFVNRSRDESSDNFGTWQTAHSSIYDVVNKCLYLYVQEEDSETTHKLVISYADLKTSELINDSGYITSSSLPESTSELTNDGEDGTSPYATEEYVVDYVDTSGGKIDKIKVNNVEQTITDKTVNITNVAKTDVANTFAQDQTLDGVLYLAQKGSNPRSKFSGGSFSFYNNNPSTTSQYGFGLYQWSDVFQFTTRASSDGSYRDEAFRINGSDALVTFKKTPKVNNTNVALASDVKNNTITITQGGVTKGTFTLNQGSNKTIALDGSPTKTSDLTNDSGFITSADIPSIPSKTSDLTNDSGFITESDIPDIPTKTSDLTNDSGFLTSHQDISGKLDKDSTANVWRVYANKNGTQGFYDVSGGVAGNTLAYRQSNGALKVGAPQADDDAATKAFVNSSIATSTSVFRGTSAAGLTEAQFLAWANGLTTKTNNDYVFWNTTDSAGNVIYKRYKYSGSSWIFEYDLNNSSFTAAQWDAVNSGITSAKVGTYDGYASTISGKLDKDTTTGVYRVYANKNGVQGTYEVSDNVSGVFNIGTIPLRTSGGGIRVPSPSNNSDAANKSYVDNHHDDSKEDKLPTAISSGLFLQSTGTPGQYQWSTTQGGVVSITESTQDGYINVDGTDVPIHNAVTKNGYAGSQLLFSDSKTGTDNKAQILYTDSLTALELKAVGNRGGINLYPHTTDNGTVQPGQYAVTVDRFGLRPYNGNGGSYPTVQKLGRADNKWADLYTIDAHFTNRPYVGSAQIALKSDYISTFYNDVGYATASQIPENTSDLNNDSGFITSSSLPTKVSDLTNDAGYITSASLPTNHVTTDTAQTISGTKTFTSNVAIASGTNEKILTLGQGKFRVNSGGSLIMSGKDGGSIHLRPYNGTGNGIAVSTGSMYPEINAGSTGQKDLGSSSSRWNTLYASTGNFLNRPTVNGSGLALQSELPTIPTDYMYQFDTAVTDGNIVVADTQRKVKDSGTSLQEIKEIAGGSTITYVISDKSDITGTEDTTTGKYTNVTAITGVTIANLKLGDNVFIEDITDPDYWVSAVNKTNGVVTSVSLNRLETQKVNLDNYVDKSTNQSIGGVKTFTSRPTVNGTNILIASDSINASTLGSRGVSDSGKRYDCIPFISSNGVMEVGRYFDFHNSSNPTSSADYNTRIICAWGTEGNDVTLPSTSGTLALTSQIPTSVDNQASSIYSENLFRKAFRWGVDYSGLNLVRNPFGNNNSGSKTSWTATSKANALLDWQIENGTMSYGSKYLQFVSTKNASWKRISATCSTTLVSGRTYSISAYVYAVEYNGALTFRPAQDGSAVSGGGGIGLNTNNLPIGKWTRLNYTFTPTTSYSNTISVEFLFANNTDSYGTLQIKGICLEENNQQCNIIVNTGAGLHEVYSGSVSTAGDITMNSNEYTQLVNKFSSNIIFVVEAGGVTYLQYVPWLLYRNSTSSKPIFLLFNTNISMSIYYKSGNQFTIKTISNGTLKNVYQQTI